MKLLQKISMLLGCFLLSGMVFAASHSSGHGKLRSGSEQTQQQTSAASAASVASAPVASAPKMLSPAEAKEAYQHARLEMCATFRQRLALVNARLSKTHKPWEIKNLKEKRTQIERTKQANKC